IQLALGSRGTNYRADVKLVGDDLSGQIDFQQALESITAKLGVKRFMGDEQVLAVIQGAVSGIRTIDAQMHLSGTALKPKFTLRSNLGQELSNGINTAFAKQLEAGRRGLQVRFEQETAKRSEKLSRLYDEQLRKLTGQLQLNQGEVQQFAQSFGLKLPGKLDFNSLGKNLPKLNAKLPKFDEQPDRGLLPTQSQSSISQRPTGETSSQDNTSNGPIREARKIEQGVEGLFRKKPKNPSPSPSHKAVQPVGGQKPATNQ
ncbi:MAG TPA: hypothetical protein VK137_10800, partial [Planctomycetaceae bacterium]|nr:hypothetical protein [Planctomycetaceae bacterium]